MIWSFILLNELLPVVKVIRLGKSINHNILLLLLEKEKLSILLKASSPVINVVSLSNSIEDE